MTKFINRISSILKLFQDLVTSNFKIKLYLVLFINMVVILSVITKSNLFIYILWLLVIFLSLFNPIFAVVGWISSLPYEVLFKNYALINPFIIINILLVVLTLIVIMKEKKILFKDIIIYMVLFVLVSMLPMPKHFYNQIYLRSIISLISVLSGFYSIAYLLSLDKDNFRLIVYNIFISTLFVSLLSLLIFDSQRLSLMGNVRSIANIVGLSIVLIFAILLEKKIYLKIRKYTDKKQLVLYLLLIIFFFFLLLTVSRGVILSVLFTIVLLAAFTMVKVTRIEFQKHQRKIVFIFILSFLTIFLLFTLGKELELIKLLTKRFSVKISDNVRWEFWSYAINSLDKIELFIGAGIGSFKSIVSDKFNYYSHSIYVDILVSTGLLGLILNLLFFIYLFIKIIKEQRIVPFTILTFTLFSFFSHGSLSTKYFWLCIALIYYSIVMTRNDITDNNT